MASSEAKLVGAEFIERALLNAFEKWTQEDINGRFWESEFRRTDWPYKSKVEVLDGEDPPKTIRENPGAFIPEAGDPRDIYDYGALMRSGIRSYKYELSNDGATAYWSWSAKNRSGDEYAHYVHEGTRFMPGRPFTDRISDAKFSLRLPVGKALIAKVRTALGELNAN